MEVNACCYVGVAPPTGPTTKVDTCNAFPKQKRIETWGRKSLLSYLEPTLSPVLLLPIWTDRIHTTHHLNFRQVGWFRRRSHYVVSPSHYVASSDNHLYTYPHHHRHPPHRRWKTSSPCPSTTSPPVIPHEPERDSDRSKAYSPKSASPIVVTPTTIND